MLLDNLAYRTARSHIRDFASESDELMLRHDEAMQCRNCETYLQLGIDAFSWLERADSQIRTSLAEGKFLPDAEVDAAFEFLYRLWLRPCKFANDWIAIQLKRDYAIDNLEKFQECASKAREIVENSDRMREISKKIPSASDLDIIAVTRLHDAWINQ